ncbi:MULTISPECIES: efflux RND transporter permease subunit [unclassified Wenzhouxiangella]|uniref:efflux RND transporter permease subunit n=1 Tax=unclassified Wenzhouxiangella TaxID=2613841 RepID=UPI000E3296FA|nr:MULTISPECIES: efflux RND transporter permease subunit [unclassified Wenzhouxiangella]RFF27488.1 efflux RND transporter permease subunit [Wenzhouxiangella sp. 15181]RFP69650.1 efflux RND transporter permease subunit [Wenzhouxiangella sp. 15190]
MNLFKLSHANPVATVVVFLIVAIMGLAALVKLPVQLTPNLEQPKITILNFWRAAAPAEMEAELVEPQEEVLETIVGLESISSSVRAGMSITTLNFQVGTDMQMKLMDVINAMNQAPPRPRDAEEPMISLGGLEQPLASLLIRKTVEGADGDFTADQELIRQTVAPALRTIEGVTKVDLNSFRDPQLEIVFDPYRMAALGLQLDTLLQRIRSAGNVSGGFASVGRREYTVRFAGQYVADEWAQMIVAYNDGRPVRLGEIAEVRQGHERLRGFAYRDGDPAFYIQLFAATNANTVEIMTALKERIARVNAEHLSDADLELILSFDASEHIKRAIALVQGNLGLGIALAMGLLYLMLRGWRATVLIAITIPFSLLAALLVLDLLGRSLNIISLAGLAFAVGLVLDAAIVVQENIVRLLQHGKPLKKAVVQGTVEVAPALFASTLTTVAIFTPIVFMQGVEGQLFFDLAVSMAVAVCASMLGAFFLVPVVAGIFLQGGGDAGQPPRFWHRLARRYLWLANTDSRALLWLLLLGPGAAAVIWVLTPETDFLPEARWEGIMTVFTVPPGASYETLEDEIGRTLMRRLEPYRTGEKSPGIRAYNLAMSEGGKVMFVYPENPREVHEVLDLLRTEILADLPDTRAFSFQSSLLSINVGGSRSVYMNFAGELDDASRQVAAQTMQRIQAEIPGAGLRPLPGLNDAQPQLVLAPDDHAVARAGLNRNQVADMVRASTSGLYVGEQFDGSRRQNIILKAPPWANPEQLQAVPMATPLSGVQTLGQLTRAERRAGPTQLRRYNGERTLTLAITPPADMSLEATLEKLAPIMADAQAQVSPGIHLMLSGGSDDLADTIATMTWNFAFAVLVLFLLMTALFRSTLDSLVVLASMPMALAGGVLGLCALNLFTFQSLDLLTMIGFVILMGLVVNNAILLIDRARRGRAEGLSDEESIRMAVETRVRPIWMSTLTSVVGMLPLVLVPGVGSEIYRGLAVVIVGGMLTSTLFTVVFMASALRMLARFRARRADTAIDSTIQTS